MTGRIGQVVCRYVGSNVCIGDSWPREACQTCGDVVAFTYPACYGDHSDFLLRNLNAGDCDSVVSKNAGCARSVSLSRKLVIKREENRSREANVIVDMLRLLLELNSLELSVERRRARTYISDSEILAWDLLERTVRCESGTKLTISFWHRIASSLINAGEASSGQPCIRRSCVKSNCKILRSDCDVDGESLIKVQTIKDCLANKLILQPFGACSDGASGTCQMRDMR